MINNNYKVAVSTSMPHTALLYSAGQLAVETLNRLADGKLGTVIQTFRNTIYVRTIDDTLVCITSHDIRGPFNLNIDDKVEFDMLGIDEPVYKLNNILKIGDLEFPLENIPIPEENEHCLISGGLEKRVSQAAGLLGIFGVEGTLLDSNSPFFRAASNGIKKITQAAKRDNFAELQNSIGGIVGLGNGSTPSGDDFLAGFLYCLRQLRDSSSSDCLKIRIEGKTSWHSRKFVEYAQRGFVIEQLEIFVNSVLSGTEEMIIDSTVNLIRIGHSSGIDSAFGVLVAASTSLDDAGCQAILKKLGL